MSKNFVKIGHCTAIRATSEKLNPSDIGQMFVPKRDEDGNIIVNDRDEVWGRVLYQQKLTFLDGTFMKVITRNLFILMTQEQFRTCPIEEGDTLPIILVRELSYKPFSEKQSPVINPQTQEAVLHNGSPFYSNIKQNELVRDIADLNTVDSLFIDSPEYHNAYATLAKKYGRAATVISTTTTVNRVIDPNNLFDESAKDEQTIAIEEENSDLPPELK